MSESKITYERDWLKRLRKKVYNQFRGKPNIDKWVVMIAAQFQDIEGAAQQLLTMPSIDDSVGAQLYLIGRIVGQAHAGEDDATYRLYLKARILANKSNGAVEDMYKVMRALFGVGLRYVPGLIKQFEMRVLSVITRQQALVALDFLGDSKEAGARGILRWQESPSAALFRFDSGPGYDVGKFAGAAES